jgi:DedD protein
LFLAGGLVTAILLVVVLVSLEDRSPVQSALPEPPIGKARIKPKTAPPTAGPKAEEPSGTVAPETFTFYDTLEQRDGPPPRLTEKALRPAPGTVSPSAPSSGLAGTRPKNPSPRFTVQVAAIKDRPTAEALKDRLKRKGYPVFILPFDIPKRGTWFRVRVGHFTKRETAQEMARQLSRRERLSTYVAKE